MQMRRSTTTNGTPFSVTKLGTLYLHFFFFWLTKAKQPKLVNTGRWKNMNQIQVQPKQRVQRGTVVNLEQKTEVGICKQSYRKITFAKRIDQWSRLVIARNKVSFKLPTRELILFLTKDKRSKNMNFDGKFYRKDRREGQRADQIK